MKCRLTHGSTRHVTWHALGERRRGAVAAPVSAWLTQQRAISDHHDTVSSEWATLSRSQPAETRGTQTPPARQPRVARRVVLRPSLSATGADQAPSSVEASPPTRAPAAPHKGRRESRRAALPPADVTATPDAHSATAHLPPSPFDAEDGAASDVSTAAVISYLITLQRLHRAARNVPTSYYQLQKQLNVLAWRLWERLPERRTDSSHPARAAAPHTHVHTIPFEWSDALCEHTLITFALFGAQPFSRSVRDVSWMCVSEILRRRQIPSEAPNPHDGKVREPVPMDVLARRARLAGLLLVARQQGDDEAAFVGDVLDCYGEGDVRVPPPPPPPLPTAEDARETPALGLPELRDALVCGVLLPELYNELARLCHCTGQAFFEARDAPLSEAEKEVISRVCLALNRAVHAGIVSVHVSADGGDVVFEAPVEGTRTEFTRPTVCRGRASAIPVPRFLRLTQRLAATVADNVGDQRGAGRVVSVAPGQPPQSAHAPHHQSPGKPTPLTDRAAAQATDNTPAGSLPTNFRFDSVLPVLQLVMNPRSFASLFSADGLSSTATGDTQTVPLVTTLTTEVALSLLHTALQWIPALLSYQLAAVASLYSRALLFSSASIHTENGADTMAPARPPASPAQLQDAALTEVRRRLRISDGENGDGTLNPGVVATALLQAAIVRLDKYFPSDIAALMSALHDVHGVLHTRACSPREAPPAISKASSPSRFTRRTSQPTSPSTVRTPPTAAAAAASAATLPSSSSASTSAPATRAFDWVEYETALQRFTSRAVLVLARRVRDEPNTLWRLPLSCRSGDALPGCVPSEFYSVVAANGPAATHHDRLVCLRLPGSLVTTAGRARSVLGILQGSTISPHELYLLTRTLAWCPVSPPTTLVSTRPTEASTHALYFPLTNLHACQPHSWGGLLAHALVGPVRTFLGLYDHRGGALAQIFASRVALLPQDEVSADFNKHHRALLVALTQHSPEPLLLSELLSTLRPFLTHGQWLTAPPIVAATPPLPLSGSDAHAPDLSSFIKGSTVLFNGITSTKTSFLRRQSSHLCVSDALSVLLVLLSQSPSHDARRYTPLCFAAWRHIQHRHAAELSALFAVDDGEGGVGVPRAVNDLSLSSLTECLALGHDALVPLFLACRAVLCGTLVDPPRWMAWRDHTDASARAYYREELAALVSRQYGLLMLHNVLMAALDKLASLCAVHDISQKGDCVPVPLWRVLATADLFTQHALEQAPTSAFPSVLNEDDLPPLFVPSVLPRATALMRSYLTTELTQRSSEDIAHTLSSICSRHYEHRIKTLALEEPVRRVPLLSGVVREHLQLNACFATLCVPARRASLHYFTLLPILIDTGGAGESRAPHLALLADPAALLGDMAGRIGTACVTVDGLVFAVQQISLVDPALLTGSELSATPWTTQHVPEAAQTRLVAALYRRTAHLVAEPLDALLENVTAPSGERDVESVQLASHEWPYSVIDFLHLIVMLLEAEALCATRAGTAASADAGVRHRHHDTTSLLVSLWQLRNTSALRLLSDVNVATAVDHTLERASLPRLLRRATQALVRVENPAVRRAGLGFLTLYMPVYAQECLSLTNRSERGQGTRTTNRSNGALFLELVDHLAAVDSRTLTTVVHRASLLVPTTRLSAPAVRCRTHATTRSGGTGARGGDRRYGANTDELARLRALLSLCLYLFQQQAQSQRDTQEHRDTSHTAQPRSQQLLAAKLLNQATRLLSGHWRVWAKEAAHDVPSMQLLLDLLDIPAVVAHRTFTWFAVRAILRFLRFRQEEQTTLAVQSVLTGTKGENGSDTGTTVEGECLKEWQPTVSPWLSSVMRVGTVDEDETADTVTAREEGRMLVSTARQLKGATPSDHLVVCVRVDRRAYVPLSTLSLAQQRQQLARWRARPPTFASLDVSLSVCLALIDTQKLWAGATRARLTQAPPQRTSDETRANLFRHHIFGARMTFLTMRELDIRHLRHQLGPMDFLTLATRVVENYLLQLPAEVRAWLETECALLSAADTGTPTVANGADPETTTNGDGPVIREALHQMFGSGTTRVREQDLRWQSGILARWLGSVADVVAHLQCDAGLRALWQETKDSSRVRSSHADAAPYASQGTLSARESAETASAHGDALETDDVTPATEVVEPRGHLTVNFNVLVRLFDVLESLCPVLRTDLRVDDHTENASRRNVATPAAHALAQVSRTVMDGLRDGDSSLPPMPRVMVVGLASLLDFRPRERQALTEAKQDLAMSPHHCLPLTRDHPTVQRALSAAAAIPGISCGAVAHLEARAGQLCCDRQVVEEAVAAAVFPGLVALSGDAGPPQGASASFGRHVHRVAQTLQADDLARLLGLLVRTHAGAREVCADGTCEAYTAVLCDALTELLPSLSGAMMRSVVQTLVQLLDVTVGPCDGAAAEPMARSLRRLLAHMAPLVAHDVERFTFAELAYVIAALHTPALFQPSCAATKEADLFAHSFVPKEAISGIHRALSTTSATPRRDNDGSSDHGDTADETSTLGAGGDEEGGDAETTSTSPSDSIIVEAVAATGAAGPYAERWRTAVYALCVPMTGGALRVVTRAQCLHLIRLVEATAC